jgi:hypothetical protein
MDDIVACWYEDDSNIAEGKVDNTDVKWVHCSNHIFEWMESTVPVARFPKGAVRII